MTAPVQRYRIDLRERSREVLLLGGASLLSLVLGWKIGHGSLRLPVALAALIGIAALAFKNFGVAIGILVVAVMNGLPGIDLESYAQSGSFRIADVAVVLMIVLLALRHFVAVEQPRVDRYTKAARAWAFFFIAWWTLTLGRSVFFSAIPVMKAALFGRDFLYFAVLLPLLVGALHTRREISACLTTLLAAALIFAFAHVGLVGVGISHAFGVNLTWFVHETLANQFQGVQRIYSYMADAVNAVVPFGIALTLMGRTRRLRIMGGCIAGLCGLSTLLQFTRATYFGLFFGLLFASAIWLSRRVSTERSKRAALVFAAGMIVVGAGVAISSNGYRSSSSSTSTVTSSAAASSSVIAARVASGVQDLSSQSGTVQYRFQVDREMRHVLGKHWLVGLGFWHPDIKYVPNLPGGSIRNADTGVFNSYMTMGLIGTFLLYLAPFGVLLAVVRSRRAFASSDTWFFFGITAWIVAVLVGTVSLVTLFSTSGLVMSALLLACTLRLLSYSDEATRATV